MEKVKKTKRMSGFRRRYIMHKLLKVYGPWCGVCHLHIDDPADITIDHKHPIAKGGTNAFDNLQLAHTMCNNKKGKRLLKTENPLFQEAFKKIDLSMLKTMPPRYVSARIWGIFPAKINMRELDLEFNTKEWPWILQFLFPIFSWFCFLWQKSILDEVHYGVYLPRKTLATLTETDKARLRQLL